MESIREIVARNCARLLDESPLTQVEIARLAHVSVTTIARWKSGIHPPEIGNLEKLAEILNVDPWEFYKAKHETIKTLPMTKIAKRICSIPDRIYELAEDLNDPEFKKVWDRVSATIKDELIAREEKVRKASKA